MENECGKNEDISPIALVDVYVHSRSRISLVGEVVKE
jgi:hypothetical protein